MTERRKSTPEQTTARMNRLLDEVIRPNAEALDRIFADGDVAVFFHDVGKVEDAQLAAESQKGARALGWRGGRTEVVRINKTRAARLADNLASYAPADPAALWLRNRKRGRIYLCVEAGSLCINYTPGEGYSFEPGTLDSEWLS